MMGGLGFFGSGKSTAKIWVAAAVPG